MLTNNVTNAPTAADALDEYARTLIDRHERTPSVLYLYDGMPYDKITATFDGGKVHLRDWDCMFGDKPKSTLTAEEMDRLVEWWNARKR